ncbi:hypothetical protein QAD02_004058 [Eretmocerus hayati]|uniref:Uncharacterized protein n=1 Tax=Eretmocerus hayati TaxID=131215 RepID=A0ACC2NPP4_9HYME|nr:hypothetical protein QAD02_004058 [Eretmocerus hayati]
MAPSPQLAGPGLRRIFNETQLLHCLIVLLGLFNLSLCLYEDQVGKFDWRQNYVGKVKFASFDTGSSAAKFHKIIVATEENVLAALNIRTGHILWRKVFEKGCAGRIRALSNVAEGKLITVSGRVPALVRYWNLALGHIVKEWTLADQNPDRIEDVKWYIKDGTLHHILPIYNSGVEVTSYDSKTGEKLKFRKVSAPFVSPETECVLADSNFVCLKQDSNSAILFNINIFEPNAQPKSITINTIFGAGAQGPHQLSLVAGNLPAVSISADNNRRKRLLLFEGDPVVVPRDIDGHNGVYVANLDNKKVILESSYNNGATTITATELAISEPQPEKIGYWMHNALYKPSIVATDCTYQSMKARTCRYLMSSEDHSISLLQQKVIWTREEALASIVAVEIVELPISEQDRAIEMEFDLKERDVLGMLVRRLTSQANQMRSFVQTLLGLEPQQSSQRADLVRDKFGLHKMIVAVTSTGKLFGIETRRGEIIWQQRVPNIRGFSQDSDKMILYVQRGSRHFPHPPQCALLAADKVTGNGVLFFFNPINGQALGAGRTELGYRPKQSMLLHASTDTFLRSIVILDEHEQAHVYPESASALVTSLGRNTYIFTVDKTTGQLAGYSLAFSTQQNLVTNKVWELYLSPKTQQITHVVSKSPLERVHSQGRVLSDRSVLYKYINPNLVAIATQGTSGAHKNTLTLYLLDVVSGTMVFSIVHKRIRGPVHIVHSENWLVYSYYNEKSRRTELASLELYEGKYQSTSTVFSSLAGTKLPLVERQAFIFPASIESMQETITEKGITSKHVLVALANGGVLELPWMLLDPRRPVNPEMREEGVIPYMPEIPIHMDGIINYNQSIHRVAGIHTSPSGLESTCLVFVRGLDLFYTRVSPSKTFDVLKEDFDYYLIVIVLAALVISSYASKKFASQKLQKQAWK